MAFFRGTSYPTVADAKRLSHATRRHGTLEENLDEEERSGSGIIVVDVAMVKFLLFCSLFSFV
jgi:hypothetical protein